MTRISWKTNWYINVLSGRFYFLLTSTALLLKPKLNISLWQHEVNYSGSDWIGKILTYIWYGKQRPHCACSRARSFVDCCFWFLWKSPLSSRLLPPGYKPPVHWPFFGLSVSYVLHTKTLFFWNSDLTEDSAFYLAPCPELFLWPGFCCWEWVAGKRTALPLQPGTGRTCRRLEASLLTSAPLLSHVHAMGLLPRS